MNLSVMMGLVIVGLVMILAGLTAYHVYRHPWLNPPVPCRVIYL
jgi:hypothetical protein